ncbi:hypothetical protein OG249_36495 [Streptomyces microflavus]|uniref:hypothetical protein n=1 Tax=Streptomyces microflavus TaxID=1919 RepID=UPI00224C96CE|nr:hypothetical protein [Streptomyces microflavus]MCX4657364.1 hypothetical protein [Streptomyces microflavus]
MTATILTLAPAPAGPATKPVPEYTAPYAPTFMDSLRTRGGADVHIHRDSDDSLSSECTGCGEYAWTLRLTTEFAQEHAASCHRPPRLIAA